MWAPQLTSFAREHRVIAPDLPGFGQSPYSPPDEIDFGGTVPGAVRWTRREWNAPPSWVRPWVG